MIPIVVGRLPVTDDQRKEPKTAPIVVGRLPVTDDRRKEPNMALLWWGDCRKTQSRCLPLAS